MAKDKLIEVIAKHLSEHEEEYGDIPHSVRLGRELATAIRKEMCVNAECFYPHYNVDHCARCGKEKQ